MMSKGSENAANQNIPEHDCYDVAAQNHPKPQRRGQPKTQDRHGKKTKKRATNDGTKRGIHVVMELMGKGRSWRGKG